MLKGCTEWPAEFARMYRQKGYWEDITLNQMLEQSVEKYGSDEAIIVGDTRYTYRDIQENIERLAAHFAFIGLKTGQRVVFQLPNSAELVIALFALLKVGAIPVMSLSPHRENEVSHFVAHAEAVGYLFPDIYRGFDYRQMADKIKAENPTLEHLFVLGEAGPGHISISQLLETPPPQGIDLSGLSMPADDVALMLLSGGTTALPKLIPRTHNDYVLNCTMSVPLGGLDNRQTLLALLPMAHNYTLASPGLLGALRSGGKIVIAPGVTPETIFPLIEKEKANVVPAVVPVIVNWLNSDIPEKHDLSSLTVMTNGGIKLQPALRRRIEEKFGCRFQEVFGTAEGLLNFTRLDASEELRFTSSGKPACPDDEVKVIDDDGNEVPEGELGELIVRGPYTIRGYYNAPEKNEEAFTADGFYRMGDIVRMKDVYIWCEGRLKDLINRGGEKISCDEVENLVITHPNVKSVGLVAMPDEVFGEKACAYVILLPGKELDLEQLNAFLQERKIAKFKLPERLEVVDEFPLSPAGKILKRDLREDITRKLANETGQQ
ncbi:MAG: AMP-binding protein [Rhodospirillales bacterium]|nr:AMP-binding protein [Rhodospirillales bacterium]